MRMIIFDIVELACNVVMIICLVKLIAMMKRREKEE